MLGLQFVQHDLQFVKLFLYLLSSTVFTVLVASAPFGQIHPEVQYRWKELEATGRFWIDPEGSHCWHGNRWCFSNDQNREAFWHHPPNMPFYGLHLAVCDVLYKKRHNIEHTNEDAEFKSMMFLRALMMKMMTNPGNLPCQMITM